MRVVIYANGTRGDVQPFVALAVGLQRAGHDVRLCTLEFYQELVQSWGVEFASLGKGDPKLWSQQETTRDYVEANRRGIGRTFQSISLTLQSIRDAWHMMEGFLADSWQAGQDAEVVIGSLFAVSAYHIAEKLGTPFVGGYLRPIGRTRSISNTLLVPTGRNLGGPLNMFTHALARQLVWQPFRRLINRWRRETLGLPALPLGGPYRKLYKQRGLRIYNLSSALFPPPREWPDWWHITGYWLLPPPPDWQPPAELVDFVTSAPPPLYVGFGSMQGRSATNWTDIVLEALARTGQRGILEATWGALSTADLPDNVFVIDDSVPHAWLFPRLKAIIGCAGGSMVTAVQAGIPTINIPQAFEQPFWARRLVEAGVAPEPIQRKEFSVDRLVAAIRTVVDDEGMQSRAAALGAKMRAEDGAARATELVTRYCTEKIGG